MNQQDWDQNTLDIAFDLLIELTDYSYARDNPSKKEEVNQLAQRIRNAVLAGWVSLGRQVEPAKHCLERAWVRGAAIAMFQCLLCLAAEQHDFSLLGYLLERDEAETGFSLPSLAVPSDFFPLILEHAETKSARYRSTACQLLSEEERRRGLDLRPFEAFLFGQLGQKGPEPRWTVGGLSGWVIAEQVYKGKDPDRRWRTRIAELSRGKGAVALDALRFHARLSTHERDDAALGELLSLRGAKLEAVVKGIDAARRVDRALVAWIAPQLLAIRPGVSAKVQKLIDDSLR